MRAHVTAALDAGSLDLPAMRRICRELGYIDSSTRHRNELRRFYLKECLRRGISLLPSRESGRHILTYEMRKELYAQIYALHQEGYTRREIAEALMRTPKYKLKFPLARRKVEWWCRKRGLMKSRKGETS